MRPLASFDPKDVAADLIDEIYRHVDVLCACVGAEYPIFRLDRAHTPLGRKMQALVKFAQTGYGLSWQDALTLLLSVSFALLDHPGKNRLRQWTKTGALEGSPAWCGGIGTTFADESLSFDAQTSYGCVILAAFGRLRLMLGWDIPVRELGALASMPMTRLRRVKLWRKKRQMVDRKSAVCWLIGRGINIEEVGVRAGTEQK